jgi:hypothetical protein
MLLDIFRYCMLYACLIKTKALYMVKIPQRGANLYILFVKVTSRARIKFPRFTSIQHSIVQYVRVAQYLFTLTAHCSPIIVHCSLLELTAHCSLLTAHSSLLTFTAQRALLTAHFSPLVANCSLLIVYCSLLTAHFSQLTVH